MSFRQPTVLHVLNASDAGGLTRYVIDVGVALRARGWRVIVACDRGAWHDKLIASGLEVMDVPLMSKLGGFFKTAAKLRRLCVVERVDLIHTHYRRATRVARLTKRHGLPPILYTLHLSHLDVSGWRGWLSDFGDYIHVASEDARQWIVNVAGVDPKRVTLIPHGIDIERWPITTSADRAAARRELDLRDDDVVSAFVGRLDEQKQPGWAVEAIGRVAKTNPRARLLVVGDGPLRHTIQAQANTLDVNATQRPRVLMLGEGDPLVAYRAADLLLSPSWREGFGYAPAEALSTGLPLLRTRTSGTHETIIENVTGQSVEIEKEAFIGACVQMLSDAPRLTSMRPACAAHARQHLRFERQVESTLKLYERLTSSIRREPSDR